ncbi:unnamed protein product, partial [Mesorhabditis belari]|uniref:GP-PDE domain-containing protein n=1 Tax=Mesorhabditis belari TaxID=2138241 RepID=A0AAF3JB90_9BILA
MHPLWAAILAISLLSTLTSSTCSTRYVISSLPLIFTAVFYLFRNSKCPPAQSMSFFTGIIIGGHRGSPWKEAENSIESFDSCKRDGCQLVEFDIEITKDSILIIMHDETTHRTTDKQWSIREKTLNEIKDLKLKFVPPYGGSVRVGGRVPTLSETVDWCKKNSIKMLFDVKHFNGAVMKTIAMLFKRLRLYETAIVSSFNPLVPYFIKRRDPRILTGYTWRRFCFSTQAEFDFSPKRSFLWNGLMEIADELNNQMTAHFFLPIFLGVDMLLVNHHDLSHMLVSHARYHGLQVVAWTTNDSIEALWIQHYLKIPFLTDSADTVRTIPKQISEASISSGHKPLLPVQSMSDTSVIDYSALIESCFPRTLVYNLFTNS